jgi:hypothetical protein
MHCTALQERERGLDPGKVRRQKKLQVGTVVFTLHCTIVHCTVQYA